MRTLHQLLERVRQKGLRRSLKTVRERYLFFHWELLWMERDLVSPVLPHKLRPYSGVRLVIIDTQNADAFARHFGDRVETMRELAAEGYTGHMYLDEKNDAVGFVWGSTRDYFDHHYYGCWFPVKPGEFFAFGGESIRRYLGTSASVDAQFEMWKAMQAQGCTKVVSVCETHNIPALKMHLRMGYQEQGRVTHVYGVFGGRWRWFRETRYSGSRLELLRKPGRPIITPAVLKQ